MAVRNAVSAATITFTASSITRCFFIVYLLFALVWYLFLPLIRGSQRGSALGFAACYRRDARTSEHFPAFRPPLAPPTQEGKRLPVTTSTVVVGLGS